MNFSREDVSSRFDNFRQFATACQLRHSVMKRHQVKPAWFDFSLFIILCHTNGNRKVRNVEIAQTSALYHHVEVPNHCLIIKELQVFYISIFDFISRSHDQKFENLISCNRADGHFVSSFKFVSSNEVSNQYVL